MSQFYLSFFHLDNSNFLARCTLCPPTGNLLKYSPTSKTNLKTHLERCHREAVQEKEKELKGNKSLNPFSIAKANSKMSSNLTDGQQQHITCN
jgi:hypothetical protein